MTTPEQAGTKPAEPSELQIIEAAEEAGLWPNTVRSWMPAFHRYHAILARAALKPSPEPAVAAPPAPAVEPVALTDAQIKKVLMTMPDIDDKPWSVAFARAILAAAQEVEFTDDPVPTYKPGPPLEWEEGGA